VSEETKMKLRIRIPGLGAAALHALERKARLFLGRHVAAIESVEVSLAEREHGAVQHADCEVNVTLHDGTAIRVNDEATHVHRALLRAAWRIDQRRELNRLRSGGVPRAARQPF
jgi:hypothetical protein